MEASPLTSAGHRGLLARPVPLLRLQSDERLVALIRDGHDRAFEVLFHRYRSRLMAFCRHLVGSPEDAEDVLQDVFASAHRAMLADDRPINARPWLYRIARNRCLNQLRQPVAEGQDSMDIHPHENGASTLEHVQRREEMRAIFADLQELPDTQRTALVLREIDDLSYDEIAEAMGVTLPAVKSLLVRARMSLAEASEARILTCDEVRLELAEAAEGLRKVCGPSRRHVRGCPQCRRYRRELRSTTRALVGALAPFGLLSLLRRLTGAKLGGASAGGAGSAGSAGGTVGSVGGVAGSAGGAAGSAGGVATALGGSGLTLGGAASAAGGAISGIGGALGAQAAIGVATAALITAGAVGVNQLRGHGPGPADRPATAREVTQPIAPAAGTTTHRDAVRYARGGGGHAGGPAAPQSASPAAETPATPAPSALAPTDPAAAAPPAPAPAAPAEEAVPPVDTASDDESGNVDEQPAADEGTATADDGEKGKSPADETDDPGDSNTGDGSDQGSGPSAKVCTRPHPPAQCAAPA